MTVRALARPLVRDVMRRIGQHGGLLDAAGLIAAFMTTPPTTARKASIRTMITALQTAGAWNGVDQLYMRAAADVQASRLNWHSAPSPQLTPVASPTFTADRFIAYNGSSQYEYVPGYQATLVSAQNLPDGPGGDPGKGYTCTGLDGSESDGSFWTGDDGRHTEGAPGVRQAAIVRLAPDAKTALQIIDIQTLFPTVGSIQGVARRWVNDTLAFASTDENLIRLISKTGVSLGSFPAANVNGLAYDSLNDAWIWMAPNSTDITATWIRCSDGTTLKTKKLRGNTDQFYFDPTDGTEGSIYTSAGNNNGAGWVDKTDVATNVWLGSWFLPEALAIEGIWVRGGVLNVLNDGYFHNGTSNQMLTYSVEPIGTGASTRIVLAGTVRMATSPAATLCILSGNDPLSAWGLGLYAPSGGTTLRMILTTTAGTQTTVNWAVAVTTRFSYWLDVDLAAKTAALWVNGALVSSQAIASAGPSLPKLTWVFGASPELPVARFSNSEHSSFMTGRGAQLAAARTGWGAAQSAYFADVGLTVP